MGVRTSLGWHLSACGVAWVHLAHEASGWRVLAAKCLPALAQPDEQSPWPLAQWQAAWAAHPQGEQLWPEAVRLQGGHAAGGGRWSWRNQGCALGMALPASEVMSDVFDAPTPCRPSQKKAWAWQQAQGLVPWPVQDLVVDWHDLSPSKCSVVVAQRALVWDRQTLAETFGMPLGHLGCETQAARLGLWALQPTARQGVQGLLFVLPGRVHLQVWVDGRGVFARSASLQGVPSSTDWEGTIGRLMQLYLTSPQGAAPLAGLHWVGATHQDDPSPVDEGVRQAVAARWHVPVWVAAWPEGVGQVGVGQIAPEDGPRLVVALGLALLAAHGDAAVRHAETHNLMPHRAQAQQRMHRRHGRVAGGLVAVSAMVMAGVMGWGDTHAPEHSPWAKASVGASADAGVGFNQPHTAQAATRAAHELIQRAKQTLAEMQALQAPQVHREQLAHDLQALAQRRVAQVQLDEVKREGEVMWVTGWAASSESLQAWMGQWPTQGGEGWGQPTLQVWAKREVDAKQPLGWKFSVRMVRAAVGGGVS